MSPDKCVVSRLSSVDDTKDATRRKAVLNRLYCATILCGCFLIVEAVGGYLAGSLAVMSDAAHLFSDLASFAVAIGASYLASLPPSETHTYGLKRSESLAALFSMLSLAFVSVILAYEAIKRFIVPPEDGVNGLLMSLIAFIGVLVNIALAFVLGAENHIHMPGSSHSHSHDHGHGTHDNHHGHGHEYGHDHHENNKNNDHDDDDHNHHHADDNSHDHGHNHDHNNTSSDKNCGHDHSHGHDHDHNDHHDDEEACGEGTTHNHDHGHDKEEHEQEHSHEHAHETDSLLPKQQQQQKSSSCDGHGTTNDNNDMENVNLRAAYLHVIGDLLQSVAVLIAGIIIYVKPSWHIVDPIITLLFCIIIFNSTIGVIRTSIAVLLEESPPNISWQKVYDTICEIPCVTNVHHLHIWSISHGEPALSVHCNCITTTNNNNNNNNSNSKQEKVITTTTCIDTIYKVVHKKFGFNHVTIQVQSEDGPCVTCKKCRFNSTESSMEAEEEDCDDDNNNNDKKKKSEDEYTFEECP